MKFRDFILKRLLASTDYLVGYDANGDYIRIGKDDLAASVASNVTVPTLQVQYSSNGSSSWHDSYSSGDIYLRIKVGSGEWSSAIRISVSAYDIWREQGNTGDEEDFLKSISAAIYTTHSGIIESSKISIDEEEGHNHVMLDNNSNNVYIYNGESSLLRITVDSLKKHIGQKQHVTICNGTKETLTIGIVNGGEDMVIAQSQLTLDPGSSVTLDILTSEVGKLDKQCCEDVIDAEYITTVCLHQGEKIVA